MKTNNVAQNHCLNFKLKKLLFYFNSLLIVFSACTNLYAQKKMMVGMNIYFEVNSAEISSPFKTQLDAIILAIKLGSPLEEIGLSGHTDSDASEAYNQQLSLERAIEVKNYLLNNGLLNVIHLDAKGEREQINLNIDENEKAKNRRVELLRNYSKNNDVFNAFKQPIQQFNIQGTEDTLLICTHGTTLSIKRNIFETQDQNAPIEVKVQEFTTKKDFILSNLCTQTLEGKMLESHGMLNIEAYQNNSRLNLKDNKAIEIGFKDRTLEDQTTLFYGTSQSNEIRWEQASVMPAVQASFGTETSWTTVGRDTITVSKWEVENIDGSLYKIGWHKKKNKIIYDTISIANEQLTSQLFLASQKLGWINCDRFYNDPAPKIDLIVTYTGTFIPSMVVLFEEINSVMPYTYREGNKLIFKNVPADKKITFIGLHKVKESDNILFAQKKTTSSLIPENIEFNNLNKSEVELAVKGL
jgi:hypothetical protein